MLGPDGVPVAAINDFLLALFHRGRSAYTLRSYARGLVHFFDWLHTNDQEVDAVTPQTVEAYIAAFSTQPKGGACPADPQKAGQINQRTRKAAPAVQRQPRTINHRLSVLASFFAYHIRQDSAKGAGPWQHRTNPVPTGSTNTQQLHGMTGRDAPKRTKAGDLRRRVPRHIPQSIEPELVEQLIHTATSWRDKAILTLLCRTGQRIGDWSSFAGRHGILGMTLSDVDERTQTITVLLKGARDEHRVPVTEDFWPLYHHYLQDERQAEATVTTLWIGFRKGQGKPLTYATFESALRYIGQKLDANVNAHMFRHTLAQAIVARGQLKVAQEILGHQHFETTADVYAHVDHHALVETLQAVKSSFDSQAHEDSAHDPNLSHPPAGYVFAYDDITLQELEQAATSRVIREE